MQSSERAEDTSNSLEGPGPEAGVIDLLPIPATNPADATADDNNQPTYSHRLALRTQDNKGLVQQGNANEVVDLGWNEKKQNIAAPLVGGIDNEDLWMLIRRFNKQIYDVRATPYPPPGGLDLNIADDEEFSPDKLRANIERLYMTVGVGLLAAFKHLARLRSWRETRRTACFAAAYFVAWLFDFLVPLLSGVLIVLVGFPQARNTLFPSAPISLVDSTTGGVQKPKAGVLGSHDSVTGAPENHKGEALEQEASNFVGGIASVALSSAAGKHPQGDADTDENAATDAAPDPTALAVGTADAKEKASGGRTGPKHDRTKVPMETAIWTKMRPIMHTIGTIADTWERLANALSPIPLFPSEAFRLRLVALLLPLVFGVSLFVTPYLLLKTISFLIGFLFFGDPILSRGFAWLNQTIPTWQKLLEPRNTILKGVPTNAQLTLTILRVGEANHAPVPPPPRIASPPPLEPTDLSKADLHDTLNASPSELDSAITPDPATLSAHETPSGGGEPVDEEDITAARDPKHGKKGGKILGFFKGTTRGAVKTAVGTDTLRAKAGSLPARNRLGVMPPRDTTASAQMTGAARAEAAGPVEFEARYEGHKGRVYISGTEGGTVPVVAFSKGARNGTVRIAGEEREDVKAVWSVPVAEVVELRKIGGYGWKAKLVVGWSMERAVKDGLIITISEGEEYRITAVPLRDELFNRLVAMGGQRWVAW